MGASPPHVLTGGPVSGHRAPRRGAILEGLRLEEAGCIEVERLRQVCMKGV